MTTTPLRLFLSVGRVALGMARGAGAQTYPAPPDPVENARVRMGPVALRPTLIIRDVGIDSNVFNESGTPQEDFGAIIGGKARRRSASEPDGRDLYEHVRVHVLPEVRVRARIQPRV